MYPGEPEEDLGKTQIYSSRVQNHEIKCAGGKVEPMSGLFNQWQFL